LAIAKNADSIDNQAGKVVAELRCSIPARDRIADFKSRTAAFDPRGAASRSPFLESDVI
jgi:hypothetical protein